MVAATEAMTPVAAIIAARRSQGRTLLPLSWPPKPPVPVFGPMMPAPAPPDGDVGTGVLRGAVPVATGGAVLVAAGVNVGEGV